LESSNLYRRMKATIVRQLACSPSVCAAAIAFFLCCGALSAQHVEEVDLPLATPVDAVQGNPAPLTFKGKTDYYVKSMFSPETLARVGVMNGVGAIGGISDDWGTGASAFGRRLGSRYASHFLSSTVRYGVGALHGEDPRFYRSGKQGFRARTGFVLSRTFVTQMDDGTTSIAAGRLAGNLAGNTLQSYMRVQNDDPILNGMMNAGFGLGTDAALRMVREFWPEIKKKFRR
jgi:hypothetical protein